MTRCFAVAIGLFACGSAWASDGPGPVRAESRTGSPLPFEFALIGDYPYDERDEAGMPYLVEELRAERNLQFVLHVGDIHSPQETDCTQPLFEEKRELLLSTGHPLILTPGDNDWADCKGDPVEKLAQMRRVFYANPSRAAGTGGFPVRPQSESKAFPEVVENVLWERDGIVFATLHMIAPDPRHLFGAVVDTRRRSIEAAEAWLDEVFREAESREARGVFLATQISLWPLSGSAHMMNLLNPHLLDPFPEFEAFQAQLVRHVRAFGRPVVLANGDTHSYRVDKPLFDEHLETLQTFTRVEGFGSPQGHWVRIRVEPDRPEVFSFRQELVPKNLYSLVPREERIDGYVDRDFGALLPMARVAQTIPKVLALIGAYVVAAWCVRRIRQARQESR